MARRRQGRSSTCTTCPACPASPGAPDGSARIGALTTVAELAGDERLRAAYPALSADGRRAGHAADPGGRHRRRKPAPAQPLLVLPQPAFSCSPDRRRRCPARDGAHPLLRGDRHGPVRRAAPVVAGDGAARPTTRASRCTAGARSRSASCTATAPTRPATTCSARRDARRGRPAAARAGRAGRLPPRDRQVRGRVAAGGGGRRGWSVERRRAITFAAVAVGGVARTPAAAARGGGGAHSAGADPRATAGGAEPPPPGARRAQTGYKVGLLRGHGPGGAGTRHRRRMRYS